MMALSTPRWRDPTPDTPSRRSRSNSFTHTPRHVCGLPHVDEPALPKGLDPLREQLIVGIRLKWANGKTLHYYFWTADAAPNRYWAGNPYQHDVVRRAFETYKSLGIGLSFREVFSPEEAEIRIGFLPGDGLWSDVGIKCLKVPTTERTMNFGMDLTDDGGFDAALHEIGHALGFHHEHQNPKCGIIWDEDAVIEYYQTFFNLTEKMIRDNVLNKHSLQHIDGTDWDRDSIMQYAVPRAGLILYPEEYRSKPLLPQAGLSKHDVDMVRYFYPERKDSSPLPTLKPFESVRLRFKPGQQLDFRICPSISRRYTINTFGSLDTKMELHEEGPDGEAIFLAADDDSGTDMNALITTQLVRGRSYVVAVRAVYMAGVDASLMLW